MIEIKDSYSYYLQGTSKKAVLLVHGLTGAPSEMKYVAKHLNKKGFSVYAPLLAGHGSDTPALLKTSWEDWYQTVEESYKKLKANYDEVYTAGICVGGALGLVLAERQPELSGVTIYSMTFRYDGWNMPKYYALAPIMPILASIPFVRNKTYPETYPFGLKDERLRKRVLAGEVLVDGALDSFPLRALSEMYKLGEKIKKILPKINTPTQLIHAKEDDFSHPRNAEYVAKNIAGPCKISWLDDSYHMVHVDQERKKVAGLTAEFFGFNEAEPQEVLDA